MVNHKERGEHREKNFGTGPDCPPGERASLSNRLFLSGFFAFSVVERLRLEFRIIVTPAIHR
jgi:hypothetical protein